LAKQYHPDSIASTSKSHEEKFKEISNAYDILGDTDKKKTYDDIRANINT
jgi:curved DNA-binding protein